MWVSEGKDRLPLPLVLALSSETHLHLEEGWQGRVSRAQHVLYFRVGRLGRQAIGGQFFGGGGPFILFVGVAGGGETGRIGEISNR